LANGSHVFYAELEAHELFGVYGAPGSCTRALALCLELLLLTMMAERLYVVVSVLHVATLSLQQRQRALAFAAEQPLPEEDVRLDAASVRAPTVAAVQWRLRARVRRWEGAAELSMLRWAVLRTPVLCVSLSAAKLLVFATLSSTLRRFPLPARFDASVLTGLPVDAEALLCIGACLGWPCLLVLVAGAQANLNTARQRRFLRDSVDADLAIVLGRSDAEAQRCYELRLEAWGALQHCALRWPGGRALGFVEPTVLVLLLLLSIGLGVAALLS